MVSDVHISRLSILRERNPIRSIEPIRDDSHIARIRIEAIDLIGHERGRSEVVQEAVPAVVTHYLQYQR